MNHQAIRTHVAQLIAGRGLLEASRALQIPAETLARIGSGAAVREGTLLVAAHRLGLLVATPLAMSSAPLPSDIAT
jgi:hypothetical protein